MCSTICPDIGAHYISFLRVRHFWKAPTKRSHQDFM